MKINYHRVSNNCISVDASYGKVDELKLIENVFFRVLKESFLNRHIKIVTREPQKYSFGYELSPHYRVKIDKIDTLINDIGNCNVNLLLEIVQTEEFKRGLLVLIESVGEWEDSIVSQIFKGKKEIGSYPTNGAIALCEDDGLTLLVFNSFLSTQFLESL